MRCAHVGPAVGGRARQLLQQRRSAFRTVPGGVEAARDGRRTAMDQAAHRLAAKPLGQHVQFLDQCSQHCVRLEQIDGYEMIRSQDLSQLQVFLVRKTNLTGPAR